MSDKHMMIISLSAAGLFVVGAWWYLCDMPIPVATQEEVATGGEVRPRQFIAEPENIVSRAELDPSEQTTGAVENEVPEDPVSTAQEIALSDWEQAFDRFVKAQENEDWKPSEKEIARFKALFDKMDAVQRLEQIPHAQNLFTDASFGFLKAILMDPTEPQEVLESIYYDLLNRPEELKYPVLREVYAVPVHPLRGEIEELAGVLGEMAQLSNE